MYDGRPAAVAYRERGSPGLIPAQPGHRNPAGTAGRSVTQPRESCAARSRSAGHADREQVIEALKDAFVQGRLTRDELDARVAQTLASRTYAELAALTADIPPAPAAAGPARPPTPARRWPLVRAAAGSGGCLVIAAAAFWGATILDPGPPPQVPIITRLP